MSFPMPQPPPPTLYLAFAKTTIGSNRNRSFACSLPKACSRHGAAAISPQEGSLQSSPAPGIGPSGSFRIVAATAEPIVESFVRFRCAFPLSRSLSLSFSPSSTKSSTLARGRPVLIKA